MSKKGPTKEEVVEMATGKSDDSYLTSSRLQAQNLRFIYDLEKQMKILTDELKDFSKKSSGLVRKTIKQNSVVIVLAFLMIFVTFTINYVNECKSAAVLEFDICQFEYNRLYSVSRDYCDRQSDFANPQCIEVALNTSSESFDECISGLVTNAEGCSKEADKLIIIMAVSMVLFILFQRKSRML